LKAGIQGGGQSSSRFRPRQVRIGHNDHHFGLKLSENIRPAHSVTLRFSDQPLPDFQHRIGVHRVSALDSAQCGNA
jgi:hypothetical protein